MSGSICLRCLTRPLAPIEQSLTRSALATSTTATNAQTASFSTTSSLAANPLKKKGSVAPAKGQKRGTPSYKQGKVKNAGARQGGGGGRSVQPGERKALRKRIVLSNTNALEVAGLEDLSLNNMADAEKQGQMLGLSNEVLDPLRAIESFKHTQGWRLFRRPATLVRKETLEMAEWIQNAVGAEQKQTLRKLLYGEAGSGKSVLQLQAQAMAFLKGWVVVHIPDAQELTIGHTSYQPSSDGTYIQPHYTAALLGRIAKANFATLSEMRLSQKHDLPIPVQENIDLARFCDLGARDPDIAWPFFQALWKELTAPSQEGKGLARPPVMFSLDSMSHIMKYSVYRSPENENIHAHDLALVRRFIDLLSGKQSLPNGGIILAADSGNNRPSTPAFEFAISRNEALQKGQEPPVWDAYVKVDDRCFKAMEGVDVCEIKGLSKDEARGVIEYYAKSGMLRSTVTDKLVGEKWTLSGGGIIGMLEKTSVMLRV